VNHLGNVSDLVSDLASSGGGGSKAYADIDSHALRPRAGQLPIPRDAGSVSNASQPPFFPHGIHTCIFLTSSPSLVFGHRLRADKGNAYGAAHEKP